MKPTARDYIKAVSRVHLVDHLEYKIKNMAIILNAIYENLEYAHNFISKNVPMTLEQKESLRENLNTIRKAKDKVLE